MGTFGYIEVSTLVPQNWPLEKKHASEWCHFLTFFFGCLEVRPRFCSWTCHFFVKLTNLLTPFPRYVDYAMHRVRLLRHCGIKPYIVFDGGLLPAKKGTESERKQKREENLARGNALAAQGKYSQAREFYLKAIDVTPQMAFQLIKVRPTNLLVIFVAVI